MNLASRLHDKTIFSINQPFCSCSDDLAFSSSQVMFVDLCNAAQTFQRPINEVSHGLEFAYIKDVLIASNSEEHLSHLRFSSIVSSPPSHQKD
ncbi:hypothetical protein LAZ67_11001208 [Cordylochernes scorpioides]|uniref:Uncharacterized protein n=1 Tax=Cordylochernes scorpioides TaxID=51811 RepID=A0ABY6L033_9ARAC|nr:hypothetical protein LAZ67_11001208 [Cordylochernes scorpioides]